jgi:hypothetical protein
MEPLRIMVCGVLIAHAKKGLLPRVCVYMQVTLELVVKQKSNGVFFIGYPHAD